MDESIDQNSFCEDKNGYAHDSQHELDSDACEERVDENQQELHSDACEPELEDTEQQEKDIQVVAEEVNGDPGVSDHADCLNPLVESQVTDVKDSPLMEPVPLEAIFVEPQSQLLPVTPLQQFTRALGEFSVLELATARDEKSPETEA